MPAQSILIQNGMQPLGKSYATVQDLINISLPREGTPGYIDSIAIQSPFNVNTRTLKVQVTIDSVPQPEYTQTFVANYPTLDALVAAIQIPGIQAVNAAGRLRLQTLKVGFDQGLIINWQGTANQFLGFNYGGNQVSQVAYGRATITSDLSEDEMAYALVTASSTADSYLQRRFTLPLSNWDYGLVKAVCDIAAYTLMFRRGFSPQNTKNYDVNFKENYEKAIAWLEEVGNRKNHPVITGSVKPNPTAYIPFVDNQRGWLNIMAVG